MKLLKSSLFWHITVIHWKSTDVLEEYVAYIFRVEE
jgi:hypothetical protein